MKTPKMFVLDASNKTLKELNAYTDGKLELEQNYQVGCVAPVWSTASQAELKYKITVDNDLVVLTRKGSQRLIVKLNNNYQFLCKGGK